MVGAQSVLVVAVVDCNLDRYGGIDQANDCGWNADIVCVTSVGSAREPVKNVSTMLRL